DLRGGRCLRPLGGRGLHPPLQPADPDLGGGTREPRTRVLMPEGEPGARPLWAGRMRAPLDERILAWSRSLPVDQALLPLHVGAWGRHVAMSARQGILAADDAAQLGQGLAALEPPGPDAPDEDVHSYIERRLVERLGELGRRVHAGRSRNDQIAVAMRLWCR